MTKISAPYYTVAATDRLFGKSELKKTDVKDDSLRRFH